MYIYIYTYHLHAFMWSLATCVSHSTLNLTGFRTNGPYWWWRPHPCASCGGTRTFRKQFGLVGKGVRLWDLQNWGFEFRWWGKPLVQFTARPGSWIPVDFCHFLLQMPKGGHEVVLEWSPGSIWFPITFCSASNFGNAQTAQTLARLVHICAPFASKYSIV